MRSFILLVAAFFAIQISLQAQITYTFNYTGSSQTVALPAGNYSIQCWGANGGTSAGGKGGYSTGSITITTPTTLHVYVGGAGTSTNSTGSGNAAGGWNGGGNGSCYSSYGSSGGGGGGTDIRTTQNTTYANRIIVAGGGGGGSVGTYGYSGGHGGGSSGLNGTSYSGYWYGRAGTQSAGGQGTTESYSTIGAGSFGVGGSHSSSAASSGWVGCGGGGGYYGGSAGGAVHSAGGGGSGYVGGVSSGSTFVSGTTGFLTNPVSTGHGLVIIKEITGFSLSQTAPIVCNGQLTAVLSATVIGGVAPYTFSWSTGATTSTIGGLGAGTYSCWVVSASSVTYSGAITVTQPSVFSSGISSQSNPLCNGGSNGYVSVYASGGVFPYTYSWSASNASTSAAYGLMAGTHSCTITDANGCTTIATTTLTQPAAPSIIAYATSSAICMGQSVTLVGGGAQSYTWTNGAINNVPFSPTVTSNYIVTGFDSQGCPGYAQTSVIVNPVPTVAAVGASLVCPGTSVTLSASGANSYVWSNGGLSSSTIVNPTVTTVYTVTGSNTFACQHSATVSVSVYTSSPISALISSSAVCAGGTVTMLGTGAVSFTWSNGNINGFPFTPTSSAVYTLFASDIYSCVKTATYAVQVNPLPVVAISGVTALCQGDMTVLSASGAGSYTWSNGAQTSSLSLSQPASSLISVTGSDANGCRNTASVNLVVTPTPTLTISAGANPMCNGTSMVLVAGGASNYTWMPQVINSISVSISPSVITSYTLIGSSNGCSNTLPITVSVIPTPTLSLSGPATAVCALTSVTLSANGASTYSWSSGANSASAVVSPSATTVYSVAGTGTNGCTRHDTITVHAKPLPVLSIMNADTAFCAEKTTTLTVSGGLSYIWSTSDTTASIVVNPSVTTTYSVTGLGSNGCSNTIDYLLVVIPCSGILDLSGSEQGILVYPNPSNGTVRISSRNNLTLTLVNSLGQFIRECHLNDHNDHTADLSQLSHGIYFIVGESQGRSIKQKIIVTY